MTSPTSRGELPAAVTPVGGIVLDLVGRNGTRVVSQAPASELFHGFFSDGEPACSRGNPGTIGVQAGLSPALLEELGGGLSEVAVRLTLFDGDTAAGEFDFGENELLLNGVSLGDLSEVATEQTCEDGLEPVGDNPRAGFDNERVDTGFFHSADPDRLSAVFATLGRTGEAVFQLRDVDPFDNFFDFTRGINGELISVSTPPVVSAPPAPAAKVPTPARVDAPVPAPLPAPLLAPLPAPLPAPAQAPLVDAQLATFLANEGGAPITLAGSPAPTGTGGPLSAVTNLPTGGPIPAPAPSFPPAPTLTPAPNTDPPVVARGASPLGGPRVEQVVANAMVGAMGSLWRLGEQVAGVVEQRLAGLLAKGGPDAPAGEAPPPAPAARGAAAPHAADESPTPPQDQPRRTNATLTVVMAVTVLVLQRVQASRRGAGLFGKRWRKSQPVPQDQPPEPTA